MISQKRMILNKKDRIKEI